MNRSSGFTLIEVLVAAMILFMVVSTALMSYQTALKGSVSAGNFLELAQVIDPARKHIRDQLNDKLNSSNELHYEGRFTVAGVEVQWQANRVESAAPPERFDPDELTFSQYKNRFFIYQVDLTLTHQKLSRTFSYDELAWLTQVEVAS